MADLYKTTKSIPSSSISSPFPTEYEDISAFLYHLLDNPNSASSPTDDKHIRSLTSFSSPAVEFCEPKVLVEDHVRSYADKECGNPVAAVQSTVSFDFFDSPGLYYAEEKESARKAYCSASVLSSDATVSPARGTKVPPEPDDDEFRGDSEVEGLEASAMSLSPAPSRSSSKRSRAAEIHNLSEKRRRSRINEKMKALQNLIPNSNKTDKASMLDEAIEYLKQLQLQVQMLTMRNGLSPHPFYLSGALESTQLLQIGSSFHECSEMLNTDRRTDIFLVDQRNSTGTTCDLPNQNTSPSQPVDLPIISGLNGPDNFEPSVEAQFGPFNLSTSRQEICRVDMSRPDLGVNFSLNNSSSILSSSSKISDG